MWKPRPAFFCACMVVRAFFSSAFVGTSEQSGPAGVVVVWATNEVEASVRIAAIVAAERLFAMCLSIVIREPAFQIFSREELGRISEQRDASDSTREVFL